jgi:hypothetical protein
LGLVVAGGVQYEFAYELAVVLGDDAQVEVAGQDQHAGPGPGVADADVVQLAGVTDGEFAVFVDAVAADSKVFADS